ncbi:MAG: hypothetical protein RID07_12980, partial [Lacipirellulaceae bacterium]
MRSLLLLPIALLALCCHAAETCHAQTGGQPVRVQLPTWHVFGASTTVLVPDRGTLVLGGVNRG